MCLNFSNHVYAGQYHIKTFYKASMVYTIERGVSMEMLITIVKPIFTVSRSMFINYFVLLKTSLQCKLMFYYMLY